MGDVCARAGARFAIAFALVAAACMSEAPPVATAGSLAGCAPGSYGALGPDECARDLDCVICRDGSACGAPVSRVHAERDGDACTVPPSEAGVCDSSGVACCLHRCVLLLGPPAFGRETDDTRDLARR